MPHRWIRREPFSLWKALCKEELCLCWGKVTVNLGKWMCLSLRIQTPTAGTGVVPSTMGTMDRGSAWLRALFFRNSRPEMTRNYSAFPAGLGQLMPNHARNNSFRYKKWNMLQRQGCFSHHRTNVWEITEFMTFSTVNHVRQGNIILPSSRDVSVSGKTGVQWVCFSVSFTSIPFIQYLRAFNT